MPSDSRLFGAERLVVYLPAACYTLQDIDGSKEKGIRNKTEQFVDSPESTFDKQPREFVGQIRHLNTNVRAFATWCQNEQLDMELCVVHEIYKKKNESEYWNDIDDLDEAGEEFANRFSKLDDEDYNLWMQKLRTDDSIVLVE